MSGGKAIGGDGGPLVGENSHVGAAHVDHRFDGERHAWFEFWSAAAFAEVRHLGILVELASNAVPNEFPHDAETVFDGFCFDKI